MAKLALYLVSPDAPELQETYFLNPLSTHTCRTIRGKLAGAYEGYGTFQWTKAVQGITLLFLKAKLRASENSDGTIPHLSGHSLSHAASLDYALDKQPTWLLDMFGWDKNGLATARRIILRSNPGRKHPGPVALRVNSRFMTIDEVEIYLDQVLITDQGALSDITQKIALLDVATIPQRQEVLAVAV